MTVEVEALISYIKDIPDFIIIVLLLAGGICGFFFATIAGAAEEIGFMMRERRIKKRLKNQSPDVIEAVNSFIDCFNS